MSLSGEKKNGKAGRIRLGLQMIFWQRLGEQLMGLEIPNIRAPIQQLHEPCGDVSNAFQQKGIPG